MQVRARLLGADRSSARKATMNHQETLRLRDEAAKAGDRERVAQIEALYFGYEDLVRKAEAERIAHISTTNHMGVSS